MERYYESLGAPSIPRDLLAGCLDETLEVERELENPFLGNCLDVADYIQGVDGPAMVFSRGAAFGDVCVAEFATGCGNAVARFRNPVLQVLTGGAVSHGKHLLAVRNHASASILAFGRKQDYADDEIAAAWESQMVDVLPFEHRPLDVAINPTLSAEVAVLLDGGDISIWNGERETRCWPIAKYDQPPAPYGMKRKSCQYGAHPRTLIVAHVDRVDTVDFRSPSIRPATVFESRSELVRGFRRDPRDPFRVVLATTSRTALIDTRFHGRTLLEWDYQNNREAPSGVEFLPPVDNDSSASFVTWARVSGEVQAYTYGSPAAQMPERKARALDDGEGALALPTIHELISPSWTAPPVSLARPTQLDPCRRSPQHPSVPRQRRYQKRLHNQHIEREEDPGWPPLRGLAISRQAKNDSGKTVLMQLADDGAIYTQPIVNGERSEEDSFRSHVEAESEGLDNAMYENPEQVAVTQYKAHRRKDWRPLAKFLRFAALNLDRASGDASPPAPLNLSEFLKSDDGTRCTTFYELAIRANRPPPPATVTLPGASFWAPGIYNLSPNFPTPEESHNVLPLTMRGFLSRTPSSLDDARAAVREVLGRSQSHDNDDDEEMALRHIAHDIRLASLVTTPPIERQFIPDNDPSQPHSFTAGTLESQHSQFSQFSQYSQLSQQTEFTQSAALDPTTATGGNHSRHQSTLHTPYAPAPIRLSATATEFRKRWTNPEDYYGPTAIYHEGPARNNNQQKRRRANDRKRSRTLSVGPSAMMATVQTRTRVTPVVASASSLAVPTPVAPAVVVAAAAAAASQVSAAAPSPIRLPTLSMSMSMDIAGSPARAPATQGSARKKPARKKGF
ncbi:hypothetical protein HDU88_007673 [Geranomyces variabilis]|nr:hypothetical protein HDU88_007673 [Geranomyces variabilis]